MRIAMIGLGRMGGNMARRLMKAGVDVVAFDRRPHLVAELVSEGAIAASGMDNLREKLGEPAIFWVMLPAGGVTEGVVQDLLVGARPGDIIVDGGNTHYKDDGRRAASARQKGVHYVDVGTSGGVWGLERGYCLMIGGEPEIVDYLTPLWEALTPGPTGVATTVGRTGDAPAERGYIQAIS
jgi:6-phosphogluconate dehydrogenase